MYRREIKHRIDYNQLNNVYKKLNLNSFYKIYDDRIINNIYFDSRSLSKFFANDDGISERNKFRIRWYGNNSNTYDYRLEIKIKKEFINKKNIIKFRLDKSNCLENYYSFCNSAFNKILDQNPETYYKYKMDTLEPTLINNYEREYFYNSNERVRITIDKKLNFISPKTGLNTYEKKVILEIKFEEPDALRKLDLDFGDCVKYSKYAKGIISTNNLINIY